MSVRGKRFPPGIVRFAELYTQFVCEELFSQNRSEFVTPDSGAPSVTFVTRAEPAVGRLGTSNENGAK
jgi:hypothetical protein